MSIAENAQNADIAARESGIKKRVASNFAWNAASEIGCKSLLLLATLYLARVLEAESFGIFSFAQTVAIYFWLSVDLGSNMYGAREAAKDKSGSGDLLNTLLSIRLTSGVIVCAALVAFSFLRGGSETERMVFLGFASYMVFRALYTEWYLRGIEKFSYVAIGNLATYSVLMALLLGFVHGKEDVVKASFIWSASFLAGGVSLIYMTKKATPSHKFRFIFDREKWMKHLRESVHFMISGGLSQLYQQLPIFLLGFVATNSEVGLYSAGHRLLFAVLFGFTVYPMAIYPILSKLHKTDERSFKKLFNLSLLGMIAVSLAFSAAIYTYSDLVCVRLLGPSYTGSVVVLKILAWFLFLRAIREVLFIAISSAGLQRYFSFASGFGVIAFTTLFFSLKYFSGIGVMSIAALSLVISEVGILGIMVYVWRMKGSSSCSQSL